MGAWAFERGSLWTIELTERAVVPAWPRVAASLGEVHRENVGPLTAAMGVSSSDPILRRFATGRRCFAARVSDQLAAYGWVSQAAECIGEQEREIRLQLDEAYIWDCATLPAYRRQRLYSALLSYIVAQLRGDGARRIWIGSSLDNRPSLQGFANAGFRPVVTLIYMRLFSLRCSWFIGHPTAPAELVGAARRALVADHERVIGPALFSLSGPARLASCAQLEG